jgi:hypothetical protein
MHVIKDRTSRVVRCGIREVISRKNGRGSLPQLIGRKKVNCLILACINRWCEHWVGYLALHAFVLWCRMCFGGGSILILNAGVLEDFGAIFPSHKSFPVVW